MTSVMTNTYAKYLRMGIVPRTVRGNWRGGEHMYSIYHKNVQYCIDDMGDYEFDADDSYIMECLKARDMIIERNHELVCDIYTHIKTKLDTDVWVRVNSGLQLNCTFGDYRGSISSLMMDFVEPELFNEAVEKLRRIFGDELGNIPDFQPASGYVMAVSGCDMSLFNGFSNPLVEILNLDGN